MSLDEPQAPYGLTKTASVETTETKKYLPFNTFASSSYSMQPTRSNQTTEGAFDPLAPQISASPAQSLNAMGGSTAGHPTQVAGSTAGVSVAGSTYQDQQQTQPQGPSQFGIPSVKPVVDDHDRLWAEIDILSETESIAQQAAMNKSFFGADHAQALSELRKAQTELVRAMAQGEKRAGEEHYQSLWE